MNERSMRWGIGLFVLLALVLLGTLIILFGSLPTLFKRSNIYTIRFVDAPGVGPGTPVRRSGVRIGEVHDVLLDDERGIVRVQVAIDPRYSLRRNEQATLNIGLLGSDASIDFVPVAAAEGEAVDRGPLEPGSELVGVRPVNVNTLLNRASEVAPTAQETLAEIRRSLQRLERMSPLAEETMREYRDLAKDVRASIPDLRRTNQQYQDLAKDVRRVIPDLEATNKEYQGLAKDVRKAIPGVQQNIDDVGAAARTYGKLGERLNLWVQANQENITKAIENLNTVLTRVSNVLNEENQRNLAVTLKNARVASERFDSISRNLDETLKGSQTLPKRIDDAINHTDEAMVTLQKTLKPLSLRSESISRNLDESLDKANKTFDDLNTLIRVFDQDGTVQRLLKDPSLYNRLDEAACMLARSMPRLDRILKDFETFADKLARHPELLGVRGAVRPSDGLKDAPQPYNRPILAPGP
jgi:phospholipid/cholesterol/gamma-HCH transport system substrate-binding protein